MLTYNNKLKQHARKLRINMTKAERILWSRLRRKQLNGLQFYRQRIIGNYIVDFYCPKANLIIEIDGSQHLTEQGINKDKTRDDYMKRQGLKVIRFLDSEVFENLEGVLKEIYEICNPPSPL